ncbi:MAG: AarF/UbiB family protein [Candidatus Berkelbacteria bacterium]|nr:AarF/UbiB family protein [Candidatus Berkelbacteria bacterium]
MSIESRDLGLHAVPPSDESTLQPKELNEQGTTHEDVDERYLSAASNQEVKILEAVYGFAPKDSPTQAKIDEISSRLFGEDSLYKVRVSRGNSIANAFALPDGHIIIHPGILQKVTTEDELAALLAHEGQHVKAGHAARQMNKGLSKRALDRVKSHAGLDRMNEVEADLVSVVNFLEKSGYNPLAGASLFERLQTEEGGWSVAHGSLEDRRLNILSLKYFLDIENISQESSPLSSEFKESTQELTQLEEKPFYREFEALAKMERQAVEELATNLTRTGDARSLLLATEALAKWREETYRLVQRHIRNNGRDEQKQMIRTSAENTTTTSFEIIAYQEASQKIFDSLQNANNFPESLKAPQLFALLEIGLAIPLQKYSKVADIKSKEGDFLSLEIVDDASENRLQSIGNIFDPELWQKGDIDFLFCSDGFQSRLEDYIVHLDKIAAVFTNEANGEFDPGIFLLELQKLALTVDRFMLQLGYDRFFNQQTFINNVATSISDSNEATIIEILERTGSTKGIDGVRRVLDSIVSKERVESDEFSQLLKQFNKTTGGSNEVSGDADEKIISYIATNMERFPTILRENCSSMAPMDASSTYLNILLALEEDDRLKIDNNQPESQARVLNLYKELMLDAGHYDINSSLWSDICNSTIRAFDSIYSQDDSEKEAALLELFKSLSDSYFEGSGQWMKGLYEWPNLFTNLMEKAIKLENEKAWSGLERWYQFTRFSWPRLNSDIYDVEKLLETIQEVIQKLWNPNLLPERKMLLADLFIDSDIRRRVKAFAANELAHGVTYGELKTLLFVDKKIGVGDSPELIDHLTENLAQTPAQMIEVQKYILDSYQESSKEIGTLTGADAVLEKILKDPSGSLLALTETREDEQGFARILIEHWWGVITKESDVAGRLDPSTLTYFDSPEKINSWIEDKPALRQDVDSYRGQLYVRIDDLLERLYRSNIVERHGIVRKLLTKPEDGVLNTRHNTMEVAHRLFDNHVKLKPERVQMVDEIMESLAGAANKDELYFLLSPLLARAILQRPTESADYRSIIKETIRDEYKQEGSGFEDELDRELPVEVPGYETLGDAAVEKTYRWSFHGKIGTENSERPINFGEQEVLRSLPEAYREGVIFEKMEESEAMIEVATTLGAPGVRFLQLLGQYVHIDPAVEQKFSAVYDSIKGQSKLSAFRTIQRERPDLLQEDSMLSARVGGGSLLTVYRHDNPSVETPTVVKVLNPNAEQRIRESMNLAHRTADRLIKKSPDNLHYKMVKEHLLADLEEWLLSDINDERFIENERQFNANWNGFKVEGSDYQIQVPRLDENSGKYVKVEEFIEGKNLTQFRVGDSTNYQEGILSEQDMKEVVRLVTSNYLYQIVSGVVHSDVHPGNFRITEDKKVAILDRNFYLELSDDDRQLFGSLTGDNVRGALAEYLLRQPENHDTTFSKEELMALLSNGVNSVSIAENPEGIFDLVTKIKEVGLKVPLRITLLLKNLYSLNNFAKNAGYNNLLEVLS